MHPRASCPNSVIQECAWGGGERSRVDYAQELEHLKPRVDSGAW